MNLRKYYISGIVIILLFFGIYCGIYRYYEYSRTPNTLHLSCYFDIFNEDNTLRNTDNKSIQIFLFENESKVEIQFSDNESLKDKLIDIRFSTLSNNNNWNHNYNCSNLNNLTVWENNTKPPFNLELDNKPNSSGRYKILNTDFNVDYSSLKDSNLKATTTIRFNINHIDLGDRDFFINLLKYPGYNITVTIDENKFSTIYSDSDDEKPINGKYKNYIFYKKNGPSSHTIQLKNLKGDPFLKIAIISLASAVSLSIGSIILTILESKETKKKLEETEKKLVGIERNSIKKDEIKALLKKLENIDKKISDIRKER